MAVGVYPPDCAKLAVRKITRPIGSRRLHAITLRQGAFGFAVERDALQASRVVAHRTFVIGSDGDVIGLRVDLFDARVVARPNAEDLATAAIADDITFLITFGPLSIRAGHFLTWRQHGDMLLLLIDVALTLHRSVNHVVEILSRLVIRRDDERRLGVFDVLVRDGGQAFVARRDFMHAPLMIKAFDGAVHVSTRELFNDGLQLRIALSHDLVEMRSADSRFLELVIRSAGVNCFMLADVADQQHTIVRPDPLQECVHLLCARQA